MQGLTAALCAGTASAGRARRKARIAVSPSPPLAGYAGRPSREVPGRGVAMRRCGRRSSESMPAPSPTGYRAFRHGSAPPCVTAPRATVGRGQPRMRRFFLRLRQNPRRATVPALRPVVHLPPADRLGPDVCRNAGTDGMFLPRRLLCIRGLRVLPTRPLTLSARACVPLLPPRIIPARTGAAAAFFILNSVARQLHAPAPLLRLDVVHYQRPHDFVHGRGDHVVSAPAHMVPVVVYGCSVHPVKGAPQIVDVPARVVPGRIQGDVA